MTSGPEPACIFCQIVRGDAAAAQSYFDGFRTTLDTDDVARSVLYALEQPRHMQVAQMFLLPTYRW